jgi:hypothetical protein
MRGGVGQRANITMQTGLKENPHADIFPGADLLEIDAPGSAPPARNLPLAPREKL